MIERKFRYHDDPHHKSNWCKVCRLYYCWHPEVKGHKNDGRAMHRFIPEDVPFTEHALDALLHATAPIPLPQVRKLIDESNNRIIAEFLEFLRFKASSMEGFDSLTVFNRKDYEEELAKWEERNK